VDEIEDHKVSSFSFKDQICLMDLLVCCLVVMAPIKIAICSESELHNYVIQEWLCCRYIRAPGVLIRVPVGGRVELADGSRYQCCGADSYSNRNIAGSDWMAGWVTGYWTGCVKKCRIGERVKN
jgi:hypothetical protein